MQMPGWRVVAGGFPTARVVGLDAAQHLPLLLVASEDGWVRVWDWMRHMQLAARHTGNMTPLCCSLHPSGLLAALGTNDTTMAVFWVLKVGYIALVMQGSFDISLAGVNLRQGTGLTAVSSAQLP